MYIKILMQYGLSEKEARAYLALLELEMASVQELTKLSGINRSTVYVILESLKKKGLASISDSKKVRSYIATSPDFLLRMIEDKTNTYQNIKRKIEVILPDMKALYKGTKTKPLIKVFEGKEGIINAFEDTINGLKDKMIRVISSPGNLGKIIYDYIPHYVEKRIRSGIKMKGIHPYDELNKKLAEESPHMQDEYMLISSKNFKLPADLAIYDNKIGYMSNKSGGTAIIIESQEIADVMKSLYDMAWKEAKRLNIVVKRKK
jgi:sugar-specific transcriptional regulator TrmB